tara:strand:+ start:107 stop:709 length:603 start_codon:yes stop_codon:yes gene_type:complete
MVNKYVGAGQAVISLGKKVIQKLSGQKELTGTAINKMPVARDLKKTRDLQDDLIKFRDKIFKGPISEQGKINVKTKNPMSQYLRKQNKNLKKPLAKGGRVGLKRGTGLMSKKSNIQKIKETFGPKQSQAKNLKTVDKKKNPGLAKLPIKVRNKMGYAAKGGRAMLKKGSKFPDLNKDGKITKADILMGRGVIKKNKKKVI